MTGSAGGWWRTGAAPGRATSVEFDCVALGGLALMERLIGYDQSCWSMRFAPHDGPPGTVYHLDLDDLPTLHADAIHDASLKEALELGRRLGATLPGDIAIIAIEAADLLDFGEGLSPAVEAAVPEAVGGCSRRLTKSRIRSLSVSSFLCGE